MRIIAALVAQLLSYLTTAAAVAHFTRPVDYRLWGLTVGIAILLEAFFFGLKECLFRPGAPNKIAGAIGVFLDGTVNTGGVLVLALGLLTFGPVALILGVLEVDVADPSAMLGASLLISALLGFALSILPHILWRDWGKKGRGFARA